MNKLKILLFQKLGKSVLGKLVAPEAALSILLYLLEIIVKRTDTKTDDKALEAVREILGMEKEK